MFANGDPATLPADLRGRWHREMVQGEEYGVETLVMDDESREDVKEYLWQRLEEFT